MSALRPESHSTRPMFAVAPNRESSAAASSSSSGPHLRTAARVSTTAEESFSGSSLGSSSFPPAAEVSARTTSLRNPSFPAVVRAPAQTSSLESSAFVTITSTSPLTVRVRPAAGGESSSVEISSDRSSTERSLSPTPVSRRVWSGSTRLTGPLLKRDVVPLSSSSREGKGGKASHVRQLFPVPERRPKGGN